MEKTISHDLLSSSHLSEQKSSAGIGTLIPGCRDFTGPVPPPLLMKRLFIKLLSCNDFILIFKGFFVN